MGKIVWVQTRRDCWLGSVNGHPRFELDIFLAGGWRRASLYQLPERKPMKFPNVTAAKKAALALGGEEC